MANLKQTWDDLEPGCVRYSPALQAGQSLRPCSVQSRARHQPGRARLTGASADQNLEEQAKAEVTLLEEGIRKQDAFTVYRCARLLAGTGIETKYRRFGRVRAVTHCEEARAVMARALGRPTGTVGNFCRDRGG